MTGSSTMISKPIADADKAYDVIIVGSGYGGGIAASRLARTGKKVAVLERGREIRPGDYPDTAAAAIADMQITTAQSGKTIGRADGLYDFRINDDMNVFLGCGLGGTSLVNANVALEIDKRIFNQHHWPKAYRDNPDLLDPYCERARKWLGSNPYPKSSPKLPKLKSLKMSAKSLKEPFSRPPINVTFKDGPNAAGVYQHACNLCGDCCTGCNYGAKNTTLMNYLPDASKNGAEIFTGANVQWVKKQDGGGWAVSIDSIGDKDADSEAIQITADVVILAAGTLGSTEILLRSKEQTGLKVSDQLGQRFSGNGDVLAFGYNANLTQKTNAKQRAPIYSVGAGHNKPDKPQFQPGPCIAGLIDMRDPDRQLKDGLVIEEGVMPGALAMGYVAIFFMADALEGDVFRFGDTMLRLEDAQKLGEMILEDPSKLADAGYSGPLSRTQSYLVMSHDDSNGQLRLKNNRAVVEWPKVGAEKSIVRDNEILQQASEAIWAEYMTNPVWEDKFGNKLITVHPIGGCPMGDNAKLGVVNGDCQVFDAGAPAAKNDDLVHDGLYVCDGAVIPGSLGVNPLLTISAITERAIEKLAADRGWTIDWTANEPEEAPAKKGGLFAFVSHVAAALKEDVSLTPAFELQMAINALQKIVTDINNKDFDAARADAKSFYSLLTMALGGASKSLPSWKTIEGYLSDAVLADDVGPIITEFMPTLQNIEAALKQGDYAKVLEIIEIDMGDFSPGLAFFERMAGSLSDQGIDRPHPVSDPFVIAGSDVNDSNFSVVGHFGIDAGSIEKMMKDRSHTAKLAGTLECPFLGGAFTFDDGATFELMPEDMKRVECWKMNYSGGLVANSQNGAAIGKSGQLYFAGSKTLKRRPGSNWWRDVTTLFVDIHDGPDTSAPLVARGIMQLGMQDLAAQAATLTTAITGKIDSLESEIKGKLLMAYLTNSLPQAFEEKTLRVELVKLAILLTTSTGHPKLEKMIDQYFLAKFGGSFVELVFRTYGGPLAYLKNFPATDDQARLKRWKGGGEPKRQLPTPVSKPSNPPTAANPATTGHFALTRYRGGSKGPVILAPGFGTTAASFAMQTTDVNLVEYLTHNDYDVWLFDYRGSPALTATRKPFTIDDIAREDWPAAVEAVQQATGAKDVQCLAHCVGSMSLLMAILSGMQGVRSIISSQTTVHPVTSWFNAAKSDIGLASFLCEGAPKSMDGLIDSLGLPQSVTKMLKDGMPSVSMVSSTDASSKNYLRDKAIDLLLWNVPFPAEEPCYNPTCHRVFGVFGASYAHDQLNEMTHNALVDVFGTVASKPFEQLALIMRKGIATNSQGTGGYLENVKRLNMPIDFVAGSRNQIFFPETSLRTLRWLHQHNPGKADDLYTRRVFDNYAHMDFFIGKTASRDIFPYLLERLEKRA